MERRKDFGLIFFLCLFFCSATADDKSLIDVVRKADPVSVRRDKHTRFVAFGVRHGARNPGAMINESAGLFGFEGPLELNAFGKRQSYAFGREIRSFMQGLLSGNYVASEATFYTSSASRTQMTLQAALAGLYPPRSFALWNLALDWSPVPYIIDDPMLRMYKVACPESSNAWKPIDDEVLQSMTDIKERDKSLLEYMSEHTGWAPTLQSAANLADNIDTFELNNFSLPEWLEEGNFTGYEGKFLAEEFLRFQELPQIECSKYEPCQHLMSGVWIQKLADLLENLVNGTDHSLKLVGFTTHTEIVLSAMYNIGLLGERVVTAGGFLMEVRDIPEWQVRFLLHRPTTVDEHVIYKAEYSDNLRNLTSSGQWIPINDLIELFRSKAISNWPLECGIEKKDTEKKIPPQDSPMSKFTVTFLLFLISCSFLALAENTRVKCPEQTGNPRMRICTMDYTATCRYFKDGTFSQYHGSSSAACICSDKVESYARGFCTEKDAQASPFANFHLAK